MVKPLRLAFTADLHWGPHSSGDEATRLMVSVLEAQAPDVLVIAGDVGASFRFGECLALFRDVQCLKAVIPGNHDIWVEEKDARGDSLEVYRAHLPSLCSQFGFHYLDKEPLILPEAELALVGSINWYDYSWAIDSLSERYPDELGRLRTKAFEHGRHNDARFVRWVLDDKSFTAQVVEKFEEHLRSALSRVPQAIAIAHHPPFYELGFPRSGPPKTLDGFLWDAFSGNAMMEGVLRKYAPQIPFAFCGHTHRERENVWNGIRGYNIGGDYTFKKLLLLDWPSGEMETHTFGVPVQYKPEN